MAIYTRGKRQFECVQLTQRQVFAGGVVAKAGEWVAKDMAGVVNICDPVSFARLFKQIYPRLAGKCRRPIPAPAAPPPSTA